MMPRDRFDLRLWFGTLGGVLAWSAHLLVGYGLEELVCAGPLARSALVEGAIVVVTLAAIAVCVAAAIVALGYARGRRAPGGGALPERVAFLGSVGVALNLLSAATVVFAGLPLLFFELCATR
jgi:hypothetical protein